MFRACLLASLLALFASSVSVGAEKPKAKAQLQSQSNEVLKKLGGGWEISDGPFANDNGTWGVTFKLKTPVGKGWLEVKGLNDKFEIEKRGVIKDGYKIVEPLVNRFTPDIARLLKDGE